jgi:L-threonylcarbamoyladenylate synthase
LREGKLVAFPTETVYGLGGDATNDRAVAAIYAAKGRPTFNPLIIHVPDAAAAGAFIVWNDLAQKLAARFWPGPLTLILPRKKDCAVSLLAGAGLETLAVRVPAHPFALALLREVGLPIAAPSANASGKLSPTTAAHVAESLGPNVDLILDAGPTTVGVESTVLDLTGEHPTILRPGGLAREEIEQCIGPVLSGGAAPEGASGLKSPGLLTSHYAPSLPLRLNATSAAANEALLCFGEDAAVQGGATRFNLSPTGNLQEAAANLFAMLRLLDQPQFRAIAVMAVPETGLGVAINDRLRRAAAPR